MELRSLGGFAILLSLLPATAFGQQHARRGTLLGGVTGALAGAAIGNENDEAVAGSVIGAAVGAITGGVIGDSVDRSQAQARLAEEVRFRQQSRAASVLDVLAMKQNGLSDAIVINHIRENGVRERLSVSDVIALHQQGLSDPVITAMQQASPSAYLQHSQPVCRPPVIVEERHYVAPPVVWRPHYVPRYHHYPQPRHHHSSFGWSFHVGH